MLTKIGSHYERQEMVWNNIGDAGFGNETVVDRVTPDMMHLVDASW